MNERFRRRLQELIAYGLAKATGDRLTNESARPQAKAGEADHLFLEGFSALELTLKNANWDHPEDPCRLELENALKKFQLQPKKISRLSPALRTAARLNALDLFCRCYQLARDLRFFNGALWAWEALLEEPALPREPLERAAQILSEAGDEFLRLMGDQQAHPLPRGGYQ